MGLDDNFEAMQSMLAIDNTDGSLCLGPYLGGTSMSSVGRIINNTNLG